MSITTDSITSKSPVTSLVGHLVDQAALSGVLKALYDQRIPILSVEILVRPRFEPNQSARRVIPG